MECTQRMAASPSPEGGEEQEPSSPEAGLFGRLWVKDPSSGEETPHQLDRSQPTIKIGRDPAKCQISLDNQVRSVSRCSQSAVGDGFLFFSDPFPRPRHARDRPLGEEPLRLRQRQLKQVLQGKAGAQEGQMVARAYLAACFCFEITRMF